MRAWPIISTRTRTYSQRVSAAAAAAMPSVMQPLGNGVSKSLANWKQGWGGKNDSFWCCYGTAIESFSKLGDSIYFRDESTSGGSRPQVWIVQFVSSTLTDE